MILLEKRVSHRMDIDNPEHYKGMARILIKQGKKDEAEYYFNKSKRVGS